MKDRWQMNMRSLEPITYRGKNRIVVVATYKENQYDSKYYVELDIKYMSDKSPINKLIADVQERLSKNFIITYQGNAIYEKARGEELVNA
jgi:hypothetical protein